MNTKSIEDKFNSLYNELYNQHYLELYKIKNEIKKEKNVRRLLWIGYVIFIIFSLYLLGTIFENIYSTALMLIIIFGSVAILGMLAMLIFYKFNKKVFAYYAQYHNTVYKFILEKINNTWKHSSAKNSAHIMDDYYESKLPEKKRWKNWWSCYIR